MINIAYAAESGHAITLYPEPIFTIGNFTVTNSLLNSWLALIIIVSFSLVLRFRLKTIPGRLQTLAEMILEQALKLADTVTNDRRRSLQFMPLALSFFVAILVNNWLGIIPGVGSIGITEGGHFVPLLRGSTADLNTTLALSIVAVIFTHIAGVLLVSWRSHLNRFIGFDLLFSIPREVFVRKNYAAIVVNPIKIIVGFIEVIGELARVASLSFRLFGNVFAGEVLLGAMATIFAFILPIPFLFLEIMVGLIQAVIFAMLVLVFLQVSSTDHAETH